MERGEGHAQQRAGKPLLWSPTGPTAFMHIDSETCKSVRMPLIFSLFGSLALLLFQPPSTTTQATQPTITTTTSCKTVILN